MKIHLGRAARIAGLAGVFLLAALLTTGLILGVNSCRYKPGHKARTKAASVCSCSPVPVRWGRVSHCVCPTMRCMVHASEGGMYCQDTRPVAEKE